MRKDLRLMGSAISMVLNYQSHSSFRNVRGRSYKSVVQSVAMKATVVHIESEECFRRSAVK